MDLLAVAILLLLIAMGAPVAIAIAVADLSFFMLADSMPTEIFIQRMVAVTHSFPLLAVPLFIMTGVIMNCGGITKRMMHFAESMTGHMVGGLAQVNVLLSTMMGGMSGSAIADAAMQAKILVPEMIKRKYGPGFSVAVTACSSIISVIIPPGIGLILYGFMGDVSIGRLFLAGIVPGLILCAAMMALVAYLSKKSGYAPVLPARASWAHRGRAFLSAGLAFLIPVFIVGGIRFGFFTPTEAGAMAVLFSILVGLLYRELRLRHVGEIIRQTVQATAIVLFIVCAASAFGYYMTWEQLPLTIARAMLSLTENPVLLLLIINVLLLAVGMFIEGSASLILLTPILVPIVTKAGIDPVHFGVVMVLNLTIAGVTPPLGTLMFTTCTIAGVSVAEFLKAAWPFFILLIAMLMVFAFLPGLSLWLPNLQVH
ncbi:MAG: TRAP transporter large permease [Alphaproteobacteria bacterium]|nr:MAG: TRAP transporter large permease [Alphaproteobacteria bacterium]